MTKSAWNCGLVHSLNKSFMENFIFFCSEYCPFHVNGLVYLITFFILIFFALSTKSVCATCHIYSIIHFKGTLLNTFYFLRYAHVRYVKSLFTKLNGQITRQFLGLRIRNLQGIVFTWTQTHWEIFKSALVYL